MEKEKAPSGPRFRKWVFGVGLVLAIVFIGPFFVPDPAPPFKFLEKAHLRWIRIRSDEDKPFANASYMLRADSNSVVQLAKAELQGWNHSKNPTGGNDFVSGDRQVTIVDWNFGTEKEFWTHVLYDYPPRLVDRIRAPVYDIKGMLP